MNYFEKNLTKLEKRQPELADLMRKEIDTSHIEILTSVTGLPTVRVTTPEGMQVVLHDLKDPVKQAQDHLKKFDLSGNNGSVLLGFGLGYLAREMAQKWTKAICFSSARQIRHYLKLLLNMLTWNNSLKSRRVKILIGKEINIPITIKQWPLNFYLLKFRW